MTTVARVVLRAQVKEVLLGRILDGTYQPGERLVETRIAQELQASQAPVREALCELEALRFVESSPFKGARVRSVSDEDLLEIYPVRAALEELAAREATARPDADLDQLVVGLEREIAGMHAAVDAGDLHAQTLHDAAFHRLIVEAAGNRTLLDAWGFLHIESRTIVTALRTGMDGHEIAERHRPVVDAIRDRDSYRAGFAARRHIEDFGHVMQEGLDHTTY